MRIEFSLAMLSFCSVAAAEIYKYVDPVTGAIEYVNQPKQGSVRMSVGESASNSPCTEPIRPLVTDDDVANERVRSANCEKAREAAAKVKAKQHAAAVAMLAREFPAACSKTVTGFQYCRPRVGMQMDRHAEALEMRRDGFTEDAVNGKLDRWRGVCTAYSRRGIVVSVTC